MAVPFTLMHQYYLWLALGVLPVLWLWRKRLRLWGTRTFPCIGICEAARL
jgi:hypothetical protein